ncbi:hypothetical protein AN416_09680 [Paraburkholderia caribensis]|nr:hypothetical protein AN416_09680 [Paraburkholderia caribensis]AUT51928.1 hypothetical protein C2L66_08720 [Paraburkholderia caribensis]
MQVSAATVGVQPTIFLSQEPYCLQQVEYERIKRGQPAAASAAMNIFLTGIGAVVTVAAQEIVHLTGKASAVDPIALYSAIGTAVLSGIVWVIVKFCPSDYTTTMKAIGEHFKKSPVFRHFGNQP